VVNLLAINHFFLTNIIEKFMFTVDVGSNIFYLIRTPPLNFSISGYLLEIK